MRKRRFWLLPAALLLVLWGLWAAERPVFQGSLGKEPDAYALEIRRMNGEDSHRLSLAAGDRLAVSLAAERGRLTLTVTGPDGAVLYRGDGSACGDFTLTVPADGDYTLTVRGTRAAGSVSALLLLRRRPLGDILGGIFGVTLMLWIGIQFYLFPLNFLSTAYFVFGLIQAATGYMAWVFRRQESFRAARADYPNIGTNPRRLVLYFSRMGYTEKAALEEADRTGARVCRLRARERTEGTLGFWWCGRFGMHGWAMPVEDTGLDLRQFDHVTLCSPIWVFRLSAPMRAFCQGARGKILSADYLLLHHQKSPYWNAAEEMDRLLGLRRSPAVSICCREGRYLAREERP